MNAKGLIVRQPWVDMILDGSKRSFRNCENCKQSGVGYLGV